jgi:hypothetical protein
VAEKAAVLPSYSHRQQLRGSDLDDVHHDRDRDRALAMSCDSVASGASHNQLPMTTGIIVRLATNTHRSGLSMATTNPTVMTVPAHAAKTRSFR